MTPLSDSANHTPPMTDSSNRLQSWHHAPEHRLYERGAYMFTCGTYLKRHHLHTSGRRTDFQNLLFEIAVEYEWQLQAWAVLANHYHFVALSPENPDSLQRFLSKLHTLSAKAINLEDTRPGRKVWYQYWDSHITYQRSYLARLKYVHHNPAHHGVVDSAAEYPWCSMKWFRKEARPSFRKTVDSLKIDKLNVYDPF